MTLTKAGKQWRKLAKAQEKLLVAYRLGRRPAESVLDAIAAAKANLRKLGELE